MNREKNNTRPDSGRVFLKHQFPALPDLKAHLIFWSLVVVGIAMDLWSKRAVFDWLEYRSSVSIINGVLRLVMAVNNGAAFGLFAGHSYWLIIVSVTALIAIVVLFLFSGTQQRLVHIALGLFAAGICGNLYDRIFNDGMVRDFIDVYYRQYHWPAFNLADSMLCVAVGLGIISCLWGTKHSS